MDDITDQLPTEIDALQMLVTTARAERDTAIAERDHALLQIDRLRHLLRQLAIRASGNKPAIFSLQSTGGLLKGLTRAI